MEEHLSNETKALYGLSENSGPDDIFQALFITAFEGKSIIKVNVIDENSKPISNAVIDVEKASGNLKNITVNSSGSYIFKAASKESVTIKINSIMLDISGSITVTAAETGILEVNLQASFVNFIGISATRKGILSSSCIRLDVSMCGGGGGGGGIRQRNGDYSGISSSGGGGGDASIEENVLFNFNEEYNIVIGSGGSRGSDGNNQSVGGAGNHGGETLAFGISAMGGPGGIGGSTQETISVNGDGGSGVWSGGSSASSNTRAGDGGNGTKYVYSSFTGTTLCGGGGGGGLSLHGPRANDGYATGGTGGSPNGQSGGSGSATRDPRSEGYHYVNMTFPNVLPSHGGGGCGGYEYTCNSSGSIINGDSGINMNRYPNYGHGGNGYVGLRMHHSLV